MARWSDRAAELLYDGETIEREIEIGSTAVVVTSNRVLAFAPEGGGANYRQVERPNVDGVGVRIRGERTYLRWGVRALVFGLVVLVAGVLLPVDSFLAGMTVPSGGAGRLGVGGVIDSVRSALGLLRQLDDVMLVVGGLLAVAALVPLGRYVRSRQRVLVIGVAGDEEPITVPVPGSTGPEVAAELESEILPEGVPSEVDSGRLASFLS